MHVAQAAQDVVVERSAPELLEVEVIDLQAATLLLELLDGHPHDYNPAAYGFETRRADAFPVSGHSRSILLG